MKKKILAALILLAAAAAVVFLLLPVQSVRFSGNEFYSEEELRELVFGEKQCAVAELMRFLADQGIRPVKLERRERTLDELFEEVTGR